MGNIVFLNIFEVFIDKFVSVLRQNWQMLKDILQGETVIEKNDKRCTGLDPFFFTVLSTFFQTEFANKNKARLLLKEMIKGAPALIQFFAFV